MAGRVANTLQALGRFTALLLLAPSPVLSGQSPESSTAELLLRIGTGDQDVYLTNVGGVTLDTQGRIWLTQPQEAVARVFSENGALLDVVGGRGEGPGEFLSPRWVGSLGDTIWISDPQQARITLLTFAGDLVDTWTASVPSEEAGLLPHRPGVLMADGSAWSPGEALSEMLTSGEVTELPLARLPSGNGTVEIIRSLRARHVLGEITFDGGEARGLYFEQPFAERDLWAVRPHGRGMTVARVDGDSVTLSMYDAGGTLEREFDITLEVDQRRTSSEAWIRAKLGEWSDLPAWMPEIDAAMLSSALYIPETLPSVFRILHDDDESIWMSTGVPGTDDREALWIKVGMDGEILRQVDFPPGSDVRAISGNTAVSVERDEYDAPFVAVYRIPE